MSPSNNRLGRLPASNGHERTETHVLSVDAARGTRVPEAEPLAARSRSAIMRQRHAAGERP
jgi:hypothetical protein